jgi:hypothetical protein
MSSLLICAAAGVAACTSSTSPPESPSFAVFRAEGDPPEFASEVLERADRNENGWVCVHAAGKSKYVIRDDNPNPRGRRCPPAFREHEVEIVMDV